MKCNGSMPKISAHRSRGSHVFWEARDIFHLFISESAIIANALMVKGMEHQRVISLKKYNRGTYRIASSIDMHHGQVNKYAHLLPLVSITSLFSSWMTPNRSLIQTKIYNGPFSEVSNDETRHNANPAISISYGLNIMRPT